MIYSARPLEETLTFFWHDHFATAVSKVNDRGLMLQQNATLRQYASGNFEAMLTAISKDPAMLIWLDNAQSQKSHPNENYGRELLELFSLGIGHYSELDVMSAAKAFTGWTLDRDRHFIFRDSIHDHTQKDFLGRVGDWNGEDVIRIVCGEFANAQLIARKLFEWLVYENAEQTVVDRFAKIYDDANNEIRPLVRAILTSPEMYSEKAIWKKVKSPVTYVVSLLKLTNVPTDQTRAASNSLTQQGQTPFNPPDVSGWGTGLDWINSGTLLSRMNFASAVAATADPVAFGAGATVTDAAGLVDLYLRRLGLLEVSATVRQRLITYVSPSGALPTGSELQAKQRGLIHLIVSLPEWQLN